MVETFRSIAEQGQATYEDRKSEFYGIAEPADSVEAAEAFIEDYQEAYADASHVVSAYRIRADPLRSHADDDGEPHNSAGKPVLTVLEGEHLENIVVVVVRYYGGTNLGIGGLVKAYSTVAREAIEDAGIVEREPLQSVTIECAYDHSGTVRGILEGSNVDFTAEYGESVSLEVSVPESIWDPLRERLMDATSGEIVIDS